jgi:hypothetical protein
VGHAPIISDSARKHGVPDEDMLHAYRNPIRLFELDEDFTMIIGADQAAMCSRWESSKVASRR